MKLWIFSNKLTSSILLFSVDLCLSLTASLIFWTLVHYSMIVWVNEFTYFPRPWLTTRWYTNAKVWPQVDCTSLVRLMPRLAKVLSGKDPQKWREDTHSQDLTHLLTSHLKKVKDDFMEVGNIPSLLMANVLYFKRGDSMSFISYL